MSWNLGIKIALEQEASGHELNWSAEKRSFVTEYWQSLLVAVFIFAFICLFIIFKGKPVPIKAAIENGMILFGKF